MTKQERSLYIEDIEHPEAERPRFTEIADIKKRVYLEAIASTGKQAESCIAAGICLRTPFNWRLDEEFEVLYQKAMLIYTGDANDRLDRIIDARVDDPEAPMSSVLLMFKKKAIDPRYKDAAPPPQVAPGNITILLNVPPRVYDDRPPAVIEGQVIKELPSETETP